MTGQAVSVVRLVLDVGAADEAGAQADLARLNQLVADLDLATAQATVQELGLLVAGVLRTLSNRYPDLDVDEFVTGWGLALALEETL